VERGKTGWLVRDRQELFSFFQTILGGDDARLQEMSQRIQKRFNKNNRWETNWDRVVLPLLHER
jgi:hypothetical protein